MSPIHGLGLFAAEAISAETLVWAFDSSIDSKIQASEVNKFTESRRATLSHFASQMDQGQWMLCGDGAIFINHSDQPNCEIIFGDKDYPFAKEGVIRTRRNINISEEITLNYLVD